jgi:hypothetical protein
MAKTTCPHCGKTYGGSAEYTEASKSLLDMRSKKFKILFGKLLAKLEETNREHIFRFLNGFKDINEKWLYKEINENAGAAAKVKGNRLLYLRAIIMNHIATTED